MHARQRGQVLVIVAVWMVALIGSAALVLLAGSVEWQRSQLQQLADQAALDSALKIGVGCSAASASTVITEADNFLATQRTRTGSLSIAGASCTAPYTGTDTFATGLTETVHYPYRLHQQQVEVVLTLSLPISFGSYMGATNTTVTRRAVAQQLRGSTAAVSATSLSCTGGQFNVAGGISATNTITLNGGCAMYAHQRFDATSGTYSDLGNVSVYNPGQTWVNGGGACVSGANSGSKNAVCADGYELSGHTAVSCGTSGTSAFLSAGDAAVNANPCAGGTARQPAAAVGTTLPPEPNLDPAAVATLPGGAACVAGASYPNLFVGGTLVGTAEAGTPAPVKDASGFYHFKPSCYGYLDFTSMKGGGITRRQQGAESATQQHFITATLPAASMAGTLLIVVARSEPTPVKFIAPAGWIAANDVSDPTSGRSEIWYYPNNPGGISSVTLTVNPATIFANAQMSEWSGVATVSPLDQTGTTLVTSNQLTATVSTSGADTMAGELVITADTFAPQAGQVIVPGAGWNNTVNDPPNDFSSEYRTDLPAGVASETIASAPATTWALTIASFLPAAAATGGAVLDPGFYYFNGSGFPGGGGICLNGAQLLARDVTLEFVNRAGFSSGTCIAGGGALCTGTCSFGATPCSISACPPNVPADSAGGGYTWFAAPCNQAPAGDASCPGSAWCPVGDRACWNLLVWAATTNTGQVTIAGGAARHWLLGSLFWPGTCTDVVNGNSTIDGTLFCGNLAVSAAAGARTAVGSDYGVSTALVEAVLVE